VYFSGDIRLEKILLRRSKQPSFAKIESGANPQLRSHFDTVSGPAFLFQILGVKSQRPDTRLCGKIRESRQWCLTQFGGPSQGKLIFSIKFDREPIERDQEGLGLVIGRISHRAFLESSRRLLLNRIHHVPDLIFRWRKWNNWMTARQQTAKK
jgi:hypothetical protein